MKKLFYIAGHGAGDPGAGGNGYTEADLVRLLGAKLKEIGGDQVILGDPKRNYYADNGISTLPYEPGAIEILEGHMDAGVTTARGGHVIIQAGLNPDNADNALASLMGSLFPGRSQLLVPRDNLANPYRASMRGYSYRLVEFGFITNAADVSVFRASLGQIATGILQAFGLISTQQKGGLERMLFYVQREGSAAQYLTDGYSKLKGIPNIPAKLAHEGAMKAACGYKPVTVCMKPADFDNFKKIVG